MSPHILIHFSIVPSLSPSISSPNQPHLHTLQPHLRSLVYSTSPIPTLSFFPLFILLFDPRPSVPVLLPAKYSPANDVPTWLHLSLHLAAAMDPRQWFGPCPCVGAPHTLATLPFPRAHVDHSQYISVTSTSQLGVFPTLSP
jgi:hypothetical protein